MLQLEASLKPIVLQESWFTAEEAALKKRGKRGGGRKKKGEEDTKSTEFDWDEMRKAGIVEDTSIGADVEEEENEEDFRFCWVSGNRAVPCDLNLSWQSTRNLVMTGGELRCSTLSTISSSTPRLLRACAGSAIASTQAV